MVCPAPVQGLRSLAQWSLQEKASSIPKRDAALVQGTREGNGGGDGVSVPTKFPEVMSRRGGPLGTVESQPISRRRRLSQGYGHFKVGRLLERQTRWQSVCWGVRSGKKKVELVDRLGPFVETPVEKKSQPCEGKKERTFQREPLGTETGANLASQTPRLMDTPTTQHGAWGGGGGQLVVRAREVTRQLFLCIFSKAMHISVQSWVARTSHSVLPICMGAWETRDGASVEEEVTVSTGQTHLPFATFYQTLSAEKSLLKIPRLKCCLKNV